jgi:hypothetical protein
MKNKVLIFLFLCFLVIVFSCKKSSYDDYAGTIVGYVNADPEGWNYSSCINCSFTNIPTIQIDAYGPNGIHEKVLCDSTGYYTFMNLKAGTYRLKFSHDNFGFIELFGIQHFAIDTTFVSRVTLLPIPPIQIINVSDTIHVVPNYLIKQQIQFKFTTDQFIDHLGILAVMSTQRDVSIDKFEFWNSEKCFSFNGGIYSVNIQDSIFAVDYYFNTDEYNWLGVNSYDLSTIILEPAIKIFYRLYLTHYTGPGVYFNYDENKYIYAHGINKAYSSDIYSFTTLAFENQ